MRRTDANRFRSGLPAFSLSASLACLVSHRTDLSRATYSLRPSVRWTRYIFVTAVLYVTGHLDCDDFARVEPAKPCCITLTRGFAPCPYGASSSGYLLLRHASCAKRRLRSSTLPARLTDHVTSTASLALSSSSYCTLHVLRLVRYRTLRLRPTPS